MALKLAKSWLKQVPPQVIEAWDADFDRWCAAVSRKDYAAIGALHEKYHVTPGGIVEQFTAKITAYGETTSFEAPTSVEIPFAIPTTVEIHD